MSQMSLLPPVVIRGWTSPALVSPILAENHYLGAIKRGHAWTDERGVIVVAGCTSRRLPAEWMELTRWCILSREKNSGSRQWAAFARDFRRRFPACTTLVSYSDPTQGHTGALYRACNWWWAPTWLRLRPPPTGNGSWTDGVNQSVKDRWIFPLRRDPRRQAILIAQDESLLRRWNWAAYREPGGVPFRAMGGQA